MESDAGDKAFGFSRRDFIKTAGLGIAAVSIPGLVMSANAGAASMTGVGHDEIETDVLVIGGGFAGIFAAMKAREKGVDVAMAVKGTVGRSGMTPWGDAFLVFNGTQVERERWVDSIHSNGEYISNLDYVKMYIDYSSKVYDQMTSWGALQDKAKTFRKKVKEAGITLLERVVITDLIVSGSRVCGAIGFHFTEDKAVVIKARSVVMASGAGAYKPNGFPLSSLTFDGDAMAYKHGLAISGKEFNDTHGTSANAPADCWAVRNSINKMDSLFYGPLNLDASIAAHEGEIPYRGSGPPGIFPQGTSGRSQSGPPGMNGSEPAGGPPGRDGGPPGMTGGPPGASGPSGIGGSMVGGASAGNSGHKTEGIWPSDSKCGTLMPGLFAAGDALASMQCGAMYTSPGVSGIGSCAQGWVAGERAAEFAKTVKKASVSEKQIISLKEDIFAEREHEKGYSPAWVTKMLQNIMIPYYVTLVKKEDRLNAALTNIEFLREHMLPKLKAESTHELRLAHDTNMVLNAEMKLRASLFRTESRGTHFREDYPFRDDKNWMAWVLIRNENNRMIPFKEPIPKEWQLDGSKSYKERYPNFRFPGEAAALEKKL